MRQLAALASIAFILGACTSTPATVSDPEPASVAVVEAEAPLTGYNIAEQERLRDSRAAWEARKAADGDYVYTTSYASVFGTGYNAEIEVSDGQVIRRKYDGFNVRDEDDALSYEEFGDAVGSNSAGPVVWTLDDLYDHCETVLAETNPEMNEITLETTEDGLFSRCTYWPKYCMDDCGQGVSIDSLVFVSEGMSRDGSALSATSEIPLVAAGMTRHWCEAGDAAYWVDVSEDGLSARSGLTMVGDYAVPGEPITYVDYYHVGTKTYLEGTDGTILDVFNNGTAEIGSLQYTEVVLCTREDLVR